MRIGISSEVVNGGMTGLPPIFALSVPDTA